MVHKESRAHQPTVLCLIAFHPLAEHFIADILERDPSLSLITWGNLQHNPQRGPSPHVFVLDTALLPAPLSEFLRTLRSSFSDAKYVVLGGNASDSEMVKLLFLGIHGFLAYDQVPGTLINAVKTVAKGNVWVPEHILQQYINVSSRMFETTAQSGFSITQRERAILELLLRHLSNKEIAAALGISESTVKFHLTHIFAKYHVTNRTSLQETIEQQRLLNRSLPLGTSLA